MKAAHLSSLLSLFLGICLVTSSAVIVCAHAIAPASDPQASKAPVVKVHVEHFQLVTGTTGWVSTGTRLLLTKDAGSAWKDITPPIHSTGTFADVLFLDALTGWVLYQSDSDYADFIVAETVNGGESWTISNVKVVLPPPEDGGPELGGRGQLAFSDRLKGYLFFNYQTGSAFSSSGLYMTKDGGNTWHDSNINPGFFGEIRAFPSGDIWAVDRDGMELAVSRGQRGFEDITLPAPASVAPAAGPRYSLPVFVDPIHGYLVVTFEGSSGPSSAAALFETMDGGHNWTSDRTFTHLLKDEIVPTVIADSTWALPFTSENSSRPSVIKLRPNDHLAAPAHAHVGDFQRCELSFASSNEGWANCAGELLSTSDGGTSWMSISPRARNGVITQDPVTPTRRISAMPQKATRSLTMRPADTQQILYATGLDQHLGFDRNFILSPAIMAQWWNSSPYYDVGIYLPGSPNGPVNAPTTNDPNRTALDSDWVNSVVADGWGIIPIWTGLQSPCGCAPTTKARPNPIRTFPSCNHWDYTNPNTGVTKIGEINIDPTQAELDGENQAQVAYSSATDLGLDGHIIYVDIEDYKHDYIFPDTNQACGAAVQAYVQGWTAEMHSLAGDGSAGVYGGIWDVVDFQSGDVGYLPRKDHRVTVWHLNHGADLMHADLSISLLADMGKNELWTNHQRIHQYNLDAKEAWGGSGGFNIDVDIVDAPVIQSSQTKPFNLGTFAFANYDETDLFNLLLANNNCTNSSGYTPGEAVGVFGYPPAAPPNTQVRSEDGYIWSSSGTASLLEIGTRSGNHILPVRFLLC